MYAADVDSLHGLPQHLVSALRRSTSRDTSQVKKEEENSVYLVSRNNSTTYCRGDTKQVK